MTDKDLSIVKNAQIIEINQDLSAPARRVWKNRFQGGSLQLFAASYFV